MSPPESNQMLKEQLRMQAKELQKRDAEKEKGDAKVKHILKLSQEKIKDLTETVAKKDEEIKQFTKKQFHISEDFKIYKEIFVGKQKIISIYKRI